MASSTSKNVINGHEFDVNKISYGPATPLGNQGGKAVSILYDNKKISVSTPLMFNWGVGKFEKNDGSVDYSLSLQFPRDNDELKTEQSDKFLENMKQFETKILNDACENSDEWLDKSDMIPAVAEALWSPMLKYTKDKVTKRPDKSKKPTLTNKMPYYDVDRKDPTKGKKFMCKVFDETGKQLYPNKDPKVTPETLITKYSKAAVVMEPYIWIVSGKFGVTWKFKQGIVQPSDSDNDVCCISIPDEMKTGVGLATYDSDGEGEESSSPKKADEEVAGEEVDAGEKVGEEEASEEVVEAETGGEGEAVEAETSEPETSEEVAIEEKPKKRVVRKKAAK